MSANCPFEYMVVHSTEGLSRRRILGSIVATAGFGGVAGCLSVDQPGASDVVAYNAAEESKTISVTITAGDAEDLHTSRSITVDPNHRVDPVNQSKLPLNTDYLIAVDVENGPNETFEWNDPTVKRAPLYVFVDDSSNIKFLLQAG